MKIVVFAGGLSGARNVSLSSGTMVAQALRDRGHRVAPVSYTHLDVYKRQTMGRMAIRTSCATCRSWSSRERLRGAGPLV